MASDDDGWWLGRRGDLGCGLWAVKEAETRVEALEGDFDCLT